MEFMFFVRIMEVEPAGLNDKHDCHKSPQNIFSSTVSKKAAAFSSSSGSPPIDYNFLKI
jgi:hypothetical protein